jgi:hypothetical protein
MPSTGAQRSTPRSAARGFGRKAADPISIVKPASPDSPPTPIKKANVMLREAPPRSWQAGNALHRRAAKHPPKRSEGLRTQSSRPNLNRETSKAPNHHHRQSKNKCHAERSAATVLACGKCAPPARSEAPPEHSEGLRTQNGRPNLNREASKARLNTTANQKNKCHAERSAATGPSCGRMTFTGAQRSTPRSAARGFGRKAADPISIVKPAKPRLTTSPHKPVNPRPTPPK